VVKPTRTDRPVKIRVSLPQSLLLEVEAYLWDAAILKPAYASRSRLIEQLLRDWLEQKKGEPDVERSVRAARNVA